MGKGQLRRPVARNRPLGGIEYLLVTGSAGTSNHALSLADGTT
jgi:hypothetical protein